MLLNEILLSERSLLLLKNRFDIKVQPGFCFRNSDKHLAEINIVRLEIYSIYRFRDKTSTGLPILDCLYMNERGRAAT